MLRALHRLGHNTPAPLLRRFVSTMPATVKTYGYVKPAAAAGTFEVCSADDAAKIEIKEYTLTNSNSVSVSIISWGATINSLKTADSAGACEDIVLGYDNLESWVKNPTYFGCIVGRVGNRIAKGKFSLDGTDYQCATNNGEHTLHGGPTGFCYRPWASAAEGEGVKFTYVSEDGEEGYPGKLTASVVYSLSADNELSLAYSGTTDAPTIINLTNHSYFNLGGADSGTIESHEFESPSRGTTAVGADLIPTGEIASVEGTPFDFRKQTSIGARIAQVENGYDHNFCVNRVKATDTDMAVCGTWTEPKSGRTMEVSTTEPGFQLYCGGFLDGSNIGRGGKGYPKFGGFCVETQHYPDAINQPNFLPITLRPGEEYTSKTVFKFGVTSKRRRDD